MDEDGTILAGGVPPRPRRKGRNAVDAPEAETRQSRRDSKKPGSIRMAVKKITALADSVSVIEYTAGAAHREITYPGLQQCISITGRHNGVILGTHISPGASSDDIEEHFDLLQTGFGPVYPEWYIAGQFQKHYATANAVMGTPEAFRKTVRKHLGKSATFHVFDTSALVNEMNSWGIDIRAELVGGEPKFSFAKWPGKGVFQSFSLWYFTKMV